MKIFCGSSRESLGDLKQVAQWVEAAGHQPMMWDDPEVFVAGDHILTRLLEITQEVDAAVLLFAEDDQVWYRDDSTMQPRDNVLLEHGLFLGALRGRKAIVCRKGKPKNPIDLSGVIHIDLDQADARTRFSAWLKKVETEKGAGIKIGTASAAELGKRSTPSNEETSFTITNGTKEAVTVHWLDFNGNRREFFTLLPNETRQQHTYKTHPWVVTDSAGKAIKVFHAPEGSEVISVKGDK